MRGFWKRGPSLDELERELRARRSEAPRSFVRGLARRAEGEIRWLPSRARIALVTALVGAALAAVASAGGLSAATSSTANAVQVMVRLASPSEPTVVVQSASKDQYTKPGKGCGDLPFRHERYVECKVRIGNVSTTEGNSGLKGFTFKISLDASPLATVTAAWTTSDGSASVTGADYIAASGTATFPPGVQVQDVTVNVVGDTVRESNENFFVTITSVSANASIDTGTGTGTIQNDD